MWPSQKCHRNSFSMYQMGKSLKEKKRIPMFGDFRYDCKRWNAYCVGGEEALVLSTLGSPVVGCCCCFLLVCQIGGGLG